jgi:hypothetical protein
VKDKGNEHVQHGVARSISVPFGKRQKPEPTRHQIPDQFPGVEGKNINFSHHLSLRGEGGGGRNIECLRRKK